MMMRSMPTDNQVDPHATKHPIDQPFTLPHPILSQAMTPSGPRAMRNQSTTRRVSPLGIKNRWLILSTATIAGIIGLTLSIHKIPSTGPMQSISAEASFNEEPSLSAAQSWVPSIPPAHISSTPTPAANTRNNIPNRIPQSPNTETISIIERVALEDGTARQSGRPIQSNDTSPASPSTPHNTPQPHLSASPDPTSTSPVHNTNPRRVTHTTPYQASRQVPSNVASEIDANLISSDTAELIHSSSDEIDTSETTGLTPPQQPLAFTHFGGATDQATDLMAPPFIVEVPNAQQMPYMQNDQPESRIIGFVAIGGSSNQNDLWIGWGMEHGTWPGFVDRVIRPQLAWGVRRIQLHSPFGKPGLDPYQLDQYQQAQAHTHFRNLTDLDAFVDAWRPVIRGDYTGGEPVEVIAYFGSFQLSPHFERLRERNDTEAWTQRAWESIKPALDAHMSIAFDATVPLPIDHPGYAFASYLQDHGVRVYSEAWPHASRPHWKRFPSIVLNQQIDVVQSNSDFFVPQQDIDTEIVHLLTSLNDEPLKDQRKDQAEALFRRSASILNGSNTLAIPVYFLDRSGYSLEGLLQAVDTYGSWD